MSPIPLGILASSAAGAGLELFGGTFDLLQVQDLDSSASQVTFENLSGYVDGYDHLRITMTARSDRASSDSDEVKILLNGSTAQYATQYMETNGSAYPAGNGGAANALIRATGGNITYMYSPASIDLIEPFNASKYISYHGHTSMPSTGSVDSMVRIFSGRSNSAETLDSITFETVNGNFTAESRFSVYGIKGS